MSREHDDLDYLKEDQLDDAIKGHARSAPPDNLLDRCLSTILSNSTTTNLASNPTGVDTVSQRDRDLRRPLVRWIIAASLLISGCVAYFYYEYVQESTRVSHALARLRGVSSESEI